METLSNCGRGGSSYASDYWLRPGQIQFPQILNIETRSDSIAWNIVNNQNIEYWDQDRFNSLKYWEYSEYWILRPGQIQFSQLLRIFGILNIETRTDSIAWSIENIQNVEYWEQDTLSALIIERDSKAKTTLYCDSSADITIEFRFWIFKVWISKLRVRNLKFRGHISGFGFLSSEFKVHSFLNRFKIFETNSYFE